MALFKPKKKKEEKPQEVAPEEKPKEDQVVTTKEIAMEVFKMLPTNEAREEFEYFYNELKRISKLQEDLETIKELAE